MTQLRDYAWFLPSNLTRNAHLLPAHLRTCEKKLRLRDNREFEKNAEFFQSAR
jgi:hypothetical protein